MYHATRQEDIISKQGLVPQQLDERYLPLVKGIFVGEMFACEQFMEITSYGDMELNEEQGMLTPPPYNWTVFKVDVPYGVELHPDVDFDFVGAYVITVPISPQRLTPVRKYVFYGEARGLERVE